MLVWDDLLILVLILADHLWGIRPTGSAIGSNSMKK
jgi:hypothetical protein